MTKPSNLNKNLHLEFETIGKYLDAAFETVRQGHMPDMTGLDKRIAVLCGILEKAEQDIQQQCLPKLGAILEKLDACEDAIRAFHAAQTQKASQ